MAEIVYEVLTEFVFDVQGAIANSSMLKSAVENISSAADATFLSLNRVGSFVSMGLGMNLTAFGVIGASLKSFENFSKNRLSFANIIGANMEHLSGDIHSFNDQLTISDKILKNIAKSARDFSLDEGAMVGSTKMLAAMLTPMGLSGKNMGNAVDMARMFEKSAPVLGVDTQLAQGQLIRMIGGQAGMDDTLFRRLVSETQPFAQYRKAMDGGKSPTQSFNKLPAAERFDMINKALAQFSANAKVNAGMADLLSARLNVVKNQFLGVDSVLIPLGETIAGPLKDGLTLLVGFIEGYVRPSVLKLSDALGGIIANPERTYASIRQLQQLRNDWPAAVAGVKLYSHALGALWLVSLPMFRTAVFTTARALAVATGNTLRFTKAMGLYAAGGWMGLLSKGGSTAMFVLKGLGFVMSRFIVPLGAFLGIMQIASRAKGYGEATDAAMLKDNGPKIAATAAELSRNLYRIVAPIDNVIDATARAMSPLFSYAFWIGKAGENMSGIVDVTEFMGNSIVAGISVLTGVSVVMRQILFTDWPNAIITTLSNISQILFDWGATVATQFNRIFDAISRGDLMEAYNIGKQPMKFSELQSPDIMSIPELMALYSAASDDVIDRNITALNDPNAEGKNVSGHTTHIGNVNIRQDFKENMEPDRIAHSFVKTLRDVAINPTQAAGRSFSGAMVR